jgi:AcrR family transcriptional regulator
MNVMSTLDLESGRRRQKLRTRDALIAAARKVVAEGAVLSVEAVAERAGISRTTAYRYFPNRRQLLAAAHPETAAESLLGADPPEDVRERLDRVIKALTALVLDTEPQQRVSLRLALEPAAEQREPLPLRQGRAIPWIEEALEPLRGELGDARLRRLVLAIRATTGIEALVWLTDIGGLSGAEARELMCWSAHSLLDAAQRVPPPTDVSS